MRKPIAFFLFTLSLIPASSWGIVNGVEATDADLAGGGALESAAAVHLPESGICTGFVVGERAILTAYHCVKKAPNPADLKVAVRSRFEEKGKPSPGSVPAYYVEVFPASGPDGQRAPTDDLALIFVREPLGVSPLRIAREDPKAPAPEGYFAFGFGRSDDRAGSVANGIGILRQTRFAPEDLRGGFGSSAEPIAFDSARTSLCNGDSGGPLLTYDETSKTNLVVGIAKSVEPLVVGDLEKDYFAARIAGKGQEFFTAHPDLRFCNGKTKYVSLTAKAQWIAEQISRFESANESRLTTK